MAHCITAIVLKGDFDKQKAAFYDLYGSNVGFGLTLFYIDHYYSAVWQHRLGAKGTLQLYNVSTPVFPSESVLVQILKDITGNDFPQFAIIHTNYWGGEGEQFANVFNGDENAGQDIRSINDALRYLGVVKPANVHDEFDAIGLEEVRHNPEYLDKYQELADEYGV